MVRSSDSHYAAAGTDPPWPPLLKGGKLAQQTRRETAAPRMASFQQPPWPPPSYGGKLRATYAAGNLRSLFCKFSTGQSAASSPNESIPCACGSLFAADPGQTWLPGTR